MTSPIDPVRRAARLRRLRRRADGSEDTGAPQDEAQLPAVAEAAPPPAPAAPAGGPLGFTAHVMAQGEQRRGLKGGPETLQTARQAYNRTEYSGQADRRAPAGRMARTKI